MSVDYGALRFPKGQSRFSDKQRRKAEEAKHQRELWAYVTERDQSCCRACRKFGSPRAIGLLEKFHHHHLEYRSRGGMDTKENVCLLCPECHQDVHDAKLRLSGDAELRDPVTHRLCGITKEVVTESGWRVERMC